MIVTTIYTMAFITKIWAI